MYKRCIDACTFAYHQHPPCGMYSYNNCCCPKPTVPRNCASCILPRRDKDDEWKCYSRCLTGLYRRNLKQQFDSPLWRRARRERDKAASTMDLPISGRCTNILTTKPSQRLPTSPEIVIERLHECPGGRLRALAKTQDCTCERMAQLLLQQKLCDKCKCNPYDSLPHVPLTFYPPKKPSFDIYGNSCDDEYAKKLLEYVTHDVQHSMTIKELLNKKFLRSLNGLYANVGGGLDSSTKVNEHRHREMKEEFEYFFGEKDTDWKKYLRRQTQPRAGRSTISVGADSGIAYDDLYTIRRSTHKSTTTNWTPWFNYPTFIPKEKRGYIKLDPESIKKYLAFGQRTRM